MSVNISGRRKCRWPKPYECVTGQCVRQYYDCKAVQGRKCTRWRPYLCPDGYCAINDTACMRPCGSRTRMYRFDYQCPGQNRTVCSRSDSLCPQVCHLHRCSDGRCKRSLLFCEPCPGYRCWSGECLTAKQQCNGVPECMGGEDELLCPNSKLNTSGGTRPGSRFTSGAVGPASGFLFLILLVLGICCRVKRATTYYGRNDTRALRRLMATIHHLSESGHLRQLRPRPPPLSPPSTPSHRMDEPAPPYSEVDSPNLLPAPPVYTEVELPPTYEEAIAQSQNGQNAAYTELEQTDPNSGQTSPSTVSNCANASIDNSTTDSDNSSRTNLAQENNNPTNAVAIATDGTISVANGNTGDELTSTGSKCTEV